MSSNDNPPSGRCRPSEDLMQGLKEMSSQEGARDLRRVMNEVVARVWQEFAGKPNTPQAIRQLEERITEELSRDEGAKRIALAHGIGKFSVELNHVKPGEFEARLLIQPIERSN